MIIANKSRTIDRWVSCALVAWASLAASACVADSSDEPIDDGAEVEELGEADEALIDLGGGLAFTCSDGKCRCSGAQDCFQMGESGICDAAPKCSGTKCTCVY